MALTKMMSFNDATAERTDGHRRMLNPKTIALIGAAEKQGSVGRAIMENLQLSKNRKIFPVNPNRTTVLGIPCYRDIRSVSEPVDLVVVATPDHRAQLPRMQLSRIVLTDNRAMLRICDELGFKTRDLSDGTTWVELALR